MSYIVSIEFPASGIKYFGEIGNQTTTIGTGIKGCIKEISEISRVINKDKSFENSKAVVIFENIDGYWDNIMDSDDQYLLGQEMRIYQNDILIFTGKISDIPETDPDSFILEADTMNIGYNDIPNKTIKKNEFNNVPADNEGKYGNIIYGVASDEGSNGTGIITAYRVDSNKFLLAWHTIKEIIKVYNKDGVDITSSCTLDNNADGNAYINYNATDLEIYVNCKGKTDSSGNLIENPALILEDMNTNFGNFLIDGIDDATTIYSIRAYKGTIVINEGLTWQEIIKQFAINFDALIFQKANGNLNIKVLNWGSEVAKGNINKIYVDKNTFRNWRDTSKIINSFRRMYWYHFRKDFFQRLPNDVDTSTRWKASKTNIDLRYTADNDTALDVSSRILFFRKTPIIWYKFDLPLLKGNNIELGEVYNLKYHKGYFPNAYRLIQIFRKTYVGEGKVSFEAMDITGINEGLIVLYEDNDPNIYKLKDENDLDCPVLL